MNYHHKEIMSSCHFYYENVIRKPLFMSIDIYKSYLCISFSWNNTYSSYSSDKKQKHELCDQTCSFSNSMMENFLKKFWGIRPFFET